MTLGPFTLGDIIGEQIRLTVSRVGSSAPLAPFQDAELEVVRPDGTEFTDPALIVGNTVQGDITEALAQVGQWKVRGHVTGSGGSADEVTSWAYFWVRSS